MPGPTWAAQSSLASPHESGHDPAIKRLTPIRFVLGICLGLSSPAFAGDFPEPTNNQAVRYTPLEDPKTLVDQFTLPDGFKATLYAAEPDIRNPIAMCWDERGRMWVAENYTYSDQKERYDLKLRDRILIFDDTDADGRFDERTVFADDLQRLTSIERGFGGVYALCPPHLLFIPCEDDRPTGPPVVLLDGFGADNGLRHTIANGLKWGPDGWLYGRTGITRTCHIGPPSTPKEERQPIGGGIWRYHPVHQRFEPYCHGTTNPWGSDWNANGDLFFINTVIGHLWHAIPGAHFKRMFGEDPYPHIYELIDQHADHYHWDTGKKWQQSRNAAGLSDGLGGGHAHVGMTIYQGEQFPETYRGRVFTANLHGRRINVDRLEPSGSGYVGKHEPDFISTSDPWFRAVEVSTGPDGSLYILDWSDIGECHEHDGVHRTSGRIYRISYGDPIPFKTNLASLSDKELIELQTARNEWASRMARWELRQRVHQGGDERLEAITTLVDGILPVAPGACSENAALRRLWLMSTLRNDTVEATAMLPWLTQDTPALHSQLIRILIDNPSTNEAGQQPQLPSALWNRITDPEVVGAHPSTRLALASSLPKLHEDQRAALARLLLSFEADSNDHNLPNLIWSGICELPLPQLVDLFEDCRQPPVLRFIARRIAAAVKESPEALDALLAIHADHGARERIDGLTQAFNGWKRAPRPDNWAVFTSQLPAEEQQAPAVIALSILFGDKHQLTALRQTAMETDAPVESRRDALTLLLELNAPELEEICESSLDVEELAPIAIRGLSSSKDPSIAKSMIRRYPDLPNRARSEVLTLLLSRPGSASLLLDHLGTTIPTADLTVIHARQIKHLNKPALNQKLSARWGELRESPEQLTQSIANYRSKLTPGFLSNADPSQGRILFQSICAACHKLYGEGGSIGPDITGSGRHSIDYLLESIVDPNAVVASEHALMLLYLKDGRVLSGMQRRQTPQTITLSMADREVTIAREEIRKQEKQKTSMMPTGLLDPLNDQELKNLISYLMSRKQVDLPK